MTQNDEIFSRLISYVHTRMSWMVIVFLFILTSLSVALIRQIVIEREMIFSTAVASHEEDLLTGNWRTFLEAGNRFSEVGISQIRVCWLGSEAGCAGTEPTGFHLLSYPTEVLIGRPRAVVKAAANISMGGPIAIILAILFLLAGCLMGVRMAIHSLKNRFRQSQNELRSAVQIAVETENSEAAKRLPSEVAPLALALLEKINRIRASENESARLSAIVEIGRKVAHDIRSPISALNLIAKSESVQSLPEAKILESVAARIQGIATDLINRQNLSRREADQRSALQIVEDIFSEHSVIYNRSFLISRNFQDLLLPDHISSLEFSRVISNLASNAAEACESGGTIEAEAKFTGKAWELAIMDNGKGIPDIILDELGEREITFGKEAGNGLGVFKSVSSVKGWGGVLRFESTVNSGTTVRVIIPAVPELPT